MRERAARIRDLHVPDDDVAKGQRKSTIVKGEWIANHIPLSIGSIMD